MGACPTVLQSCHSRFRGFEAAEVSHLLFDTGEVAEDMANRFNLRCEGRTPVMVGDDAPQPLPDPLLGIQLRRIGRLGLQYQSAAHFPAARL
jgi:hypothetical protein